MKDRRSREDLFKELEQYIEENWIPSMEDILSDKPVGGLRADTFLDESEDDFIEDILPDESDDDFAEDILPDGSEDDFIEDILPDESAEDLMEDDLVPEKEECIASPKPLDIFRKGAAASDKGSSAVSLDDLIREVGRSFHEVLFELVAASGMTDVEVYKRACLDRKLFSKIRNNPAYHPGKNTVLALAVALRLDISQTQDLLARAEYALSPGSKSDVIIRYFIEREVYDIDIINIALDDHGLPVLQ